MSLWIWTLTSLSTSSLPSHHPTAVSHIDDFEIGPLISILAPYHSQYIPPSALSSLTTFSGGPHFVHKTAYSPFADLVPRNITTWMSPELTIGATNFHENRVGGPGENPSQFNPVVAQWSRNDNSIGFFSLYAETQSLRAEVSENKLNLTYPSGKLNEPVYVPHQPKFAIPRATECSKRLGGYRRDQSESFVGNGGFHARDWVLWVEGWGL